jgi:hypothetical protein
MKEIKSLKELKAEKARLKLQLSSTEELIREDVEWINQELSPLRQAGKLFSSAMVNKNHGILNNGVRFTIDGILKNLILSRAGWITRLVVPYLAKNLSSNYIMEKRPEIFGILRNLIHKARKSTHINHNHNHRQNHFDKSTVDEMDY